MSQDLKGKKNRAGEKKGTISNNRGGLEESGEKKTGKRAMKSRGE